MYLFIYIIHSLSAQYLTVVDITAARHSNNVCMVKVSLCLIIVPSETANEVKSKNNREVFAEAD